MKKLIFGFSLLCVGMLSSCIDKNEEVDEDVKPAWLGNSIYDELANPKEGNLEGTFSTYLWLVDQLDYKEVLSRTGSKTVFPANDEAFARFFDSEPWPGVKSKEDLTEAQKKILLYTSMLDNSMLVNMMSNVNNGNTGVIKGKAMKHATSVSVIDTVSFIKKPTEYYLNNPYFKWYSQRGGMYAVSDATSPMMIHFTREYMLNNGLTTLGSQSDFSVLMGREYKEGDAYIFRNQIIHKDVTCQNGYIHQVDNVITQPGNMAQLLKQCDDTKLISRMIDRFAMPFYSESVTRAYNDWAVQYNHNTIDSIFEIRYMSELSYDNQTQKDPNGGTLGDVLLPYDLGWNAFEPNANSSLSDVAAMLVPTDESVSQYFLPGGAGQFLIEQYGKKPNNRENLEENIDSIPQDKIKVILTNLMKAQLSRSVPSMFSTWTNTASDLMGLSLNDLRTDDNGAYDVRIANNGVLYMLNHMIAPPEFSAVSAPATIFDRMKVINWVIQNKSRIGTDANVYSIGLDYYSYLLAMSANFAQFLPTDQAFNDFYYVNPATLSNSRPNAIHFYYDDDSKSKLCASVWAYNPTTKQIGDSIGYYNMDDGINDVVKSILVDMMNMHTIVLGRGERLGENNFYITKLGAGVRVTGGSVGDKVATSAHLDNGLTPPTILTVYNQENGDAFELDRVIQAPTRSVYKVLLENPNLSEFLNLCLGFGNTDLMDWLGIESTADPNTGLRPIDQYLVFIKPHAPGYSVSADDNSRYEFATYEDDYVVNFFNTFNYTVYAPNNTAMDAAYAAGLPKWEDILELYTKYDMDGYVEGYDDGEKLKAKLLKDVNLIRQFVRYHFQNSTVFADNKVSTSTYQTFMPDKYNINQKLQISGGNGQLKVVDAVGKVHIIDANATDKTVNAMTRDVILNARYDLATQVYTSSFAAVHELDEALCPSADNKFSTVISKAPRRR